MDYALTQTDFEANYAMTDEQVALVHQVLDLVEKNPERWNQSNYGNLLSDENCFFGLLIRVSGINPNGIDSESVEYDGFSIFTGMRLLGMSDDHRDRAEYISYWYPNKLEATIENLRNHVSEALSYDFSKSNNVVVTDEGDPVLTN